jgi:hypothetical protein
MLKLFQSILHWIFTWVYFVCVICFIGAMAGVATHVLFAFLFQEQADYAYFASFGFLNGLKYGSLWAGGLSIVLCVIKARKKYLVRHGVAEGAECKI